MLTEKEVKQIESAIIREFLLLLDDQKQEQFSVEELKTLLDDLARAKMRPNKMV